MMVQKIDCRHRMRNLEKREIFIIIIRNALLRHYLLIKKSYQNHHPHLIIFNG